MKLIKLLAQLPIAQALALFTIALALIGILLVSINEIFWNE